MPIEILYGIAALQIALQAMSSVLAIYIGRRRERAAWFIMAGAFGLMCFRRVTGTIEGLSRPNNFIALLDGFIIPCAISILIFAAMAWLYGGTND